MCINTSPTFLFTLNMNHMQLLSEKGLIFCPRLYFVKVPSINLYLKENCVRLAFTNEECVS